MKTSTARKLSLWPSALSPSWRGCVWPVAGACLFLSACGSMQPGMQTAPGPQPQAGAGTSTSTSTSNTTNTSTGTPISTQDERQMTDALAASADAWNRGDLAGHLAIYDASITTMTKAGPRPTIAAIEASFRAAYFSGDKPRQALRMERVAIRALSTESALMTGRFVLDGGGLPEQSGWFTLVWLRTAAGWRVVHDHTS